MADMLGWVTGGKRKPTPLHAGATCPNCGRGRLEETEPYLVRNRGETAYHMEPGYKCPTCKAEWL